ncbi:LCP family protein [Candidatus Saccharibacteria bacterium]|nr:LCP family protein [Candidatus Saccharibacteria bacterium]
MKTNKSIDGLTTRDAKKLAAVRVAQKNASISAAAKTKKSTKKVPISSKQPTTKTSSPVSTKTLSTTKTTTSSKIETSDITPTQKVEDFLKPVQAFDFDDSGELKKSKDSVKDMKESTKTTDKKSKTKKKPSKARRIITSILLFIVLVLIGLITWAVFWGNDIIAKITGGQGNVFDLFSLTEEKYDPLKTDANGRTNILAFGTSGYNMEGDEGDGTHDGAQLTDSIMMISINQETGDIAMLSLPRDLKASPTCTATGKINEVYWCNNMNGDDEAAGATALMAEVGNILGVDFQYYAHLNWGSLVQIVDTLGGIKVTLDEDINDAWWTGAVYEAGVEYTLNGEEALGLARARHGTSGGDFSRGASQQKILVGIKDAVFEKNLSLPDMLSLASALGDNLRTNFSLNEFKTLAHLTFEFDLDSMRQISLWPDYMTTGSINGISYVLPRAGVGNYGVIQEYVAKMTSNNPVTYEEPSVIIYNASEQPGLASKEHDLLVEEGYPYVFTDNAPEAEYPVGTTLYMVGDKPGSKHLLEAKYGSAHSAEELPEGITREYDFVIIINPESTDTTTTDEQ